MQGQSTINNQTTQDINGIKCTLTKLTTSLSTQDKGKFPAQPQPNPQGQFGVNKPKQIRNIKELLIRESVFDRYCL